MLNLWPTSFLIHTTNGVQRHNWLAVCDILTGQTPGKRNLIIIFYILHTISNCIFSYLFCYSSFLTKIGQRDYRNVNLKTQTKTSQFPIMCTATDDSALQRENVLFKSTVDRCGGRDVEAGGPVKVILSFTRVSLGKPRLCTHTDRHTDTQSTKWWLSQHDFCMPIVQ
jgi:hypothetical protein